MSSDVRLRRLLLRTASPLAAGLILSACGGLGGLAVGPYPGVPEVTKRAADGPQFPAAVLYRFDDQRYLLLDDRYYCTNGDIIFVDEARNIRTKVSETGRVFKGIYVNSSKGTIVVPAITSPDCSSGGGRVCGMYLYFSVDGGRTFEELNGPWGALDTPRVIAVEGNKLYFSRLGSRNSYTLVLQPGLRLTKKGDDFKEELVSGEEVLQRAASPSGETKFECREK